VLTDLALGQVVHETQLEHPALDFGQRLPAFRDGVAVLDEFVGGVVTAEQLDQEGAAGYEQELARYLQERIKPGLNRSAIRLLARSIAKQLAHRERLDGASENVEAGDEQSADTDDEHSTETDDEHSAEAEGDEPSAETDDEHSAGGGDEPSAEGKDEPSAESEAPPDLEADMHELQAELGEDWILRFSLPGDDAWLTAEKDDGSQRVEAPIASVLSEAVQLLNEDGGRST
jgi:hypothetical protein